MNEDIKYLYATEFVIKDCHVNKDGYFRFSEFQTALVNAATMQCKKYGIDIDSLIPKGLSWVISKIRIKFFAIPKVGDLLKIETWPVESGRLVFDRDFRVYANGKVVAIASSRWCVIDVKTRLPVRTNTIFSFDNNTNKKLIIDSAFVNQIETLSTYKLSEHVVSENEIDINGHLNNARYYDIAMQAIKKLDGQEANIKEVFIHYLRELLPGERIIIKSSLIDNTYYVFGYKDPNCEQVAFEFNAIV